MPTLNWIGKEAVVNHHHQVPFRLLKDVPELGCGEPGTGNLIVEGDNLEALKALLPYYAGQVKCIYIDPPYNTGNEGWVYNDNVRSPIIEEWLGKTVGKEGETLDRHDRWLCMMYPRLALLRDFLREDGSIWVSIDDNEVGHLRLLMDEIFGSTNFVADVIWEKADSPKMDANLFSTRCDHTVVYSRWIEMLDINRVVSDDDVQEHYNKTDDDGRRYYLKPLRAMMGGEEEKREARPKMFFPLTAPDGTQVFPKTTTGADGRWRWGADKVEKEAARIDWVKGRKGWTPYYRIYADTGTGRPPETLFTHQFAGSSRLGKAEIKELFSDGIDFATPKPTRLIERILQIATNPGDLVLDSFGGSGTTGHAVLKLNASGRLGLRPDNGSAGFQPADSELDLQAKSPQATDRPEAYPPERRFILVEMEPEIAPKITAERVKRVAQGYTNAKGDAVPGLGGGFRYCRLGEPLFDADRQIRESVTFGELARHVYFTETGEPLPRERVPNTPLLGVCRGVAIYLLYNGILGDKSTNGGNVLTRGILAKLPKYDGQKVIYCAGCLLGKERQNAERILIRQTPYEIKIS
jgi:adenine-specific DNA-methyltransferase